MYVAQQNIYACYAILHYLTGVLKACTYLMCSWGSHTRMHTRTHTLTQFSKELNSQSCIDEEQQHEEQTQIPHLDRHVKRTHIHTHRYVQYVIHRNKRHVQSTSRGVEHTNRERGGEAGDRNVVSW